MKKRKHQQGFLLNPFRFSVPGGGALTFISAASGALGTVADDDYVLLFLLGVGTDPAAPSGWKLEAHLAESNAYRLNVYSSLYDAGNAAVNSTNFPPGTNGYFFTLVYRSASPLALLQIGAVSEVSSTDATLGVAALSSTTDANSVLLAWVSNRDPAGTESSDESMTNRFTQGHTFFHVTAWEQSGAQSGVRNFTRTNTNDNFVGLLFEIGSAAPYYGTPLHQLLFTGSNGSTSITDSGSAGATVTVVGDAQIQSNRLALDGSGDYVSLPTSFTTLADDWVIRGDATLDAFESAFFSGNSGGGNFYFNIYAGSFLVGDGTTNPISLAVSGVTLGVNFTWQVENIAGVLKLKIDGVVKSSVPNTLSNYTITTLYIGSRPGIPIYTDGSIDNVEVFVNP